MKERDEILEQLTAAKKAGASIPQIAESAGVHAVTLYRWINGESKPHNSTRKLVRAALEQLV